MFGVWNAKVCNASPANVAALGKSVNQTMLSGLEVSVLGRISVVQHRSRFYKPATLLCVLLVGLVMLGCGGPGGDPPKNFDLNPAIASVSPNFGPVTGGTSVIITGVNFENGATVFFGGVAVNNATIVNGSRIEATTPAHSAGMVTVEVSNPGRRGGVASLANGFRYSGFSVSSVSPDNGPPGGGTAVTINGTEIQSGVTAFFGSSQATSVVFLNPNQITAVTPAGPAGGGTVNVQLTNPTGESTSLTNGFTYNAPLTVSNLSPDNGGTAGGTTITINGTGFVSGATVTFGGIAGTSVTLLSSTQLQAVTPPHSAGTVNVVVTNPGGQSATLTNSFTYGNQPTVSNLSPGNGPTAGGTAVTINGSNFQSGVSVSFGGTNATSVTLVNSSQLTVVTPAHATGTVNVVVTNPGPLSATLTNGFTYTDAPLISSINPVSGPTAGAIPVTIFGSNFQSGATVSFGGTNSSTVTFINSTQLTAVSPAHAAGTVNVVVTNPGGQNATLTNAFTYVAGLAVTSISPSSGPTSGGTAVTINGSGFQSGATVDFLTPSTPAGTPATNVVFVNSTTITAVTPASTADVADVRVTNPGGSSATLLSGYTYFATISVTGVNPGTGTTAGGTNVTITGTSFASGATVAFGGVNAPLVTFVNSGQLNATTPAHAAGPVDVRVSNLNGDEAILTNGFTYTAPPVVNNVSPNNGSPSGGNVVIINGSAFQSGATATFGGTPATGVTFISSSQLQVTTPAHAPGAVTVQVTNPNAQSGSKASAFTYNTAMSVTGISPNGGLSAGGETVAVTGSGFQANTTVFFDSESAQGVTLVNSTQLSVVTPSHPTGFADINVSTPDGQFDALTGSFEFTSGKTQITTPSIASISPISGAQNGGTSVTITGVNFVSGAQVRFDGVLANSINVISGGQITCTTPPHAGGTVEVTVTNPDGGTDTLGNSFTYIGLDLVTLSPPAADIAGGTVITLNGTGFQNGATVLMGGVLAASTFINTTQVQATAPPHAAGVVDVKITNPDASTDTLAASLTYANPPGIASLTPDTGLNTGGTTVIIRGVGYQNGATVKFGALSAASVTFVSSSELQIVTPAQAVGTVNVEVRNPDGAIATRVNGFRYGQILFQDDFEGGSFANFDFVTIGNTINTNAAFVKNGSRSSQTRYTICSDSANTACGSSHQDRNLYFEKNFAGGLPRHFFVRGYVYIKTPEAPALATSPVQRKLFYIKAATGPSGTPNALWYVVLTEDTVNARMGVRVVYSPKSGVSSFSFYGQDNELGNKSTLINGIFELQFDRFHLVEMEVKSKSGLGAQDAILRLYIDGTLVFQHTIFTTGACRVGGTVPCPAFPDDSIFPSSITRIEIGNQADRTNFNFVDEFRFWDGIVVADAYVGP